MNRWLLVGAALLPLAALAGSTQCPPDMAKGQKGVSWEGQLLRATGAGAPDLKAANAAQARLGAERAAQMDALRKLLEQAKGIQISAGKTVGDQLANDEVRGKVEGVLRGFCIADKRYFSDSGVEVDVVVPLSAIAAAVAPKSDAVAVNSAGKAEHTGLVIDARGLKISPALAPRLLDESGKALYAAAALKDDAMEKNGVAGWSHDLEAAKKSDRVGDKPLVVKAAKANGSDLVLDAQEAKKLAAANNGYLAEGRVIIVTQP